ncbi:MAG: T9SS type A sorting domain-containing protein, partial [Sphingobacteriales bacterium]
YQQNAKGRFSQQIDLNGATPGIYFLQLNADGQKQIQKMTVK